MCQNVPSANGVVRRKRINIEQVNGFLLVMDFSSFTIGGMVKGNLVLQEHVYIRTSSETFI